MPKKVTLRHYGKVVSGKRIYYNELLHKESVYALEGQEFEEVIKLKHKTVSTDAHGYYRGGILGECMGYEIFRGWDREEIHAGHFAPMFLSWQKTVKYMAGEETMYRDVTVIDSTASLSSKEMFEFCEKCIQWCAEHGIIINSPEQYLLGKFKTETKAV